MLYDGNGSFYFLEMNTRLQVEHPVTEMVTGIDLVRWQLRIAQGERLDIDPERALTPDGHAIECRVYAEDPNAGFMPCPGLLTAHRPPAGPGVRVDAGVEAGFEVPVHYDSMVSKLVVHASDRATAIARMDRALAEYEIGGVSTTIPLFRWLLARDDVVAGRFDTAFLDRVLAERNGEPFVDPPEDGSETAILAAALSVALGGAPAAPSTDGGPTGGRTPRHSRWRLASRVDALR
jgi:acetyl/propionyl-CoA carboxylase alpha subunit